MESEQDFAWASPVFVTLSISDSKDSTSNSSNNDSAKNHIYWTFQRDFKSGVNIFAYLLINDFGKDKIVSKFIAESLIQRIFNSLEMTSIVQSIHDEKTTHNSLFLEDRIKNLLRNVFINLDSECYEAVLKPILEDDQKSTQDWDDSSISLTSGCSSILALILDNRLFVANCGNSVGILGVKIGGEMAVFQVSETHDRISNEDETHNSEGNNVVKFLLWPPQRCFGDYGRKTEMSKPDNKSNIASSEPYIVQNIGLNHTVRFLLLISPITAKVVEILNPEHQANAVLSSMIIESLTTDEATDTSTAITSVLKRLSSDFLKKFGSSLNADDIANFPKLSLAYLNLENDENEDDVIKSGNIPFSDRFSTNTNSISTHEVSFDLTEPSYLAMNAENVLQSEHTNNDRNGSNLNVIRSEVDWSEFYTNELHDTVVAKIESLKQYYRDCKAMDNIEE